MRTIYLIKGAQATTAIEGNTLTEAQVGERISKTLKLPESREYLGTEIDNVVEALGQIMKRLYSNYESTIKIEDILEGNRMVLKGLAVDSNTRPGEIRHHSVTVGNYLGAPPEDCEYLVYRLCEWLNSKWENEASDRMAFGVLRAVVAHLYLAWIHPFGDGNGRTARLLEYQILTAAGVPDIAAHVLTNHYNLTRAEYYRQLDAASKSGGNVIPFLLYAVKGFVDGLQEQLDMIRKQQLELAWRDFVHEKLPDSGGRATIRQRHLLLALSTERAAPVANLRKLDHRVATEYASVTRLTFHRDVDKLVAHDLLTKEVINDVVHVKANLDCILAFQPSRATDQGQTELELTP
jgi:Fic family protein